MPQSLAKVLLHIIFSTKGHTRWLQTPDIRIEMNAYVATVLKSDGSPALIVNCVSDHMHIVCVLSRTRTVAQVVETVKKSSSKWVKSKSPAYRDFHWQNGYGVFSVSQSKIEETKAYVLNQEKHHRQMTFRQEFEAFLKRHAVPYDERYVWD